jgi:DNA polymerase III epsilon subunit-like protein
MSAKKTYTDSEFSRLKTCAKYHDIDKILDAPYIIVFDTETTGVLKTDEIVQLGYVVFSRRGKLLHSYEEVWRTTKQSHPEALRLHRLSSEVVQQSIKSAETEIPLFMELVNRVKGQGGKIVAHNAAFDVRMLKQTGDAHKCALSIRPDDVFCTMKALKAVSVDDRGPNVKLEQVYTHLDGPALVGYHTALVDSQATAFVYFKGLEKQWWD